jgi:hypothetical protein
VEKRGGRREKGEGRREEGEQCTMHNAQRTKEHSGVVLKSVG